MNKCESLTCENVAIFTFNWGLDGHSDYTRLFCEKHATVAGINLTDMGLEFSKQVICIMERT